MRLFLFALAIVVSSALSLAQNTYFSTTFKVDSAKFTKEATERVKKMTAPTNRFNTNYEKAQYEKGKEYGTFNYKDSLKVVYVYGFDDFIPDEKDAVNNAYLTKITPRYNITSYRLPKIYGNKYPKSKRLDGSAFVIDQNNRLVGKLESSPTMTYYLQAIKPIKDLDLIENNTTINNALLVQNVLSKDFDRLFYVGCLNYDYVWCVKGDNTTIYDIEKHNFIDLKTYLKMYKDILSKSQKYDVVNSFNNDDKENKQQAITFEISTNSVLNLNDSIQIRCMIINGSDSSISFEKNRFGGIRYFKLANADLLLCIGDNKFLIKTQDDLPKNMKAKCVLSKFSFCKFFIMVPADRLKNILSNNIAKNIDMQLKLTLTKPKGLTITSNKFKCQLIDQ